MEIIVGEILTEAAPFEALIPSSVGDIWHVHERGFRMAIFNLGVLGGIVSCVEQAICTCS